MRKQKKMMLMVMAALALTACGSSEEPKQEMAQSESTQKQSTEEKSSSAGESKTDEKVKLVLMHYAAEETKRSGIDAWVQSVTEQYPDIEIEVQAVTPWAQFASSLQTKIAAGDAPDIFMGKPSQFIQLAEAGQVLDLTGQKCLDNLSEVDKAMVSVGEKVLSLIHI